MKLTRHQASTLVHALKHWTGTGQLSESQAELLERDLEIVAFDWKKLAKYSMWIALICILTSIGAVLADKALLALIETYFNAPAWLKFLGLGLIAAVIFWAGFKRKQKHPEKVFSNEGILCLAVIATAGSIFNLGKAMDTGSGHFSILLLLACFLYGVIGYCQKSNLIWLFSLLSLGTWMGTETGYASGWGAYYLGMNYPLRFVFFGVLLTALSFALKKKESFSYFLRTTQIMGLLYLFVAVWIMSIFGNYGDVASWQEVRQYELLSWSLIFAVVALGAIYYGLKNEDGVTKGFGITFLLINLYTRFFEYFWDATYKAVFFAILGASFWFLGSRAERIWNLGRHPR